MSKVESIRMSAPFGARQPGTTEKAVTPAEARELRGLYDKLAVASSAAGLELGRMDASPAALETQGFKDLNARVDAMLDRIKAILG